LSKVKYFQFLNGNKIKKSKKKKSLWQGFMALPLRKLLFLRLPLVVVQVVVVGGNSAVFDSGYK